MVKNTPANAGDTGWILVQEDSACHGAAGPVLHNCRSLRALEPVFCNEKPLQRDAQALQPESSANVLQLEKAHAQWQRPIRAKDSFKNSVCKCSGSLPQMHVLHAPPFNQFTVSSKESNLPSLELLSIVSNPLHLVFWSLNSKNSNKAYFKSLLWKIAWRKLSLISLCNVIPSNIIQATATHCSMKELFF